jgi:hypothetical protein
VYLLEYLSRKLPNSREIFKANFNREKENKEKLKIPTKKRKE